MIEIGIEIENQEAAAAPVGIQAVDNGDAGNIVAAAAAGSDGVATRAEICGDGCSVVGGAGNAGVPTAAVILGAGNIVVAAPGNIAVGSAADVVGELFCLLQKYEWTIPLCLWLWLC